MVTSCRCRDRSVPARPADVEIRLAPPITALRSQDVSIDGTMLYCVVNDGFRESSRSRPGVSPGRTSSTTTPGCASPKARCRCTGPTSIRPGGGGTCRPGERGRVRVREYRRVPEPTVSSARRQAAPAQRGRCRVSRNCPIQDPLRAVNGGHMLRTRLALVPAPHSRAPRRLWPDSRAGGVDRSAAAGDAGTAARIGAATVDCGR